MNNQVIVGMYLVIAIGVVMTLGSDQGAQTNEAIYVSTTTTLAPTTTTLAPTTTTAPAPTTTTLAPTTTTLAPTTTTIAPPPQTEPCESPDSALTLAEQQNACALFLLWWLTEGNYNNGLYLSGIDVLSVDDSTTLTIFIGAEDGTNASILQGQVDKEYFNLYPAPEEWFNKKQTESQLTGANELAIAEAARIQGKREVWFGLIAFSFASYADLLDVDAIVLRIAYWEPKIEGGWEYASFTATPDGITAEFPGTLEDMLVDARILDEETFNSIYKQPIANAFGVFVERKMNTSTDALKPSLYPSLYYVPGLDNLDKDGPIQKGITT